MRHKQGPRLEVKSSLLQRSSKVGPQLCRKNHGPLFDCITRMRVCVCVCVCASVCVSMSDMINMCHRRRTMCVCHMFNKVLTYLLTYDWSVTDDCILLKNCDWTLTGDSMHNERLVTLLNL